jgi:hypothetical protein
MNVSFQVSKKITVSVEGESVLDVVEKIANAQEVFSDNACGKCKSEDIAYRVRLVTEGKKPFKYPELFCRACGAKLAYGQSEGGKLFPIRFERKDGEYTKNADGSYINKGVKGWVKFNKQTNKEE